MSNLLQWWEHVATLFKGTVWAWWRLLPLLLGTYTIGWMGNEAALIAAASISDSHPWISMGLVSLGFAALLSGSIICLQLLGRELGIRRRVPKVVEDDRDTSLGRLLAITLLPFLGIYATFGKVQETAGVMVSYEIIIRGVLEQGVLNKVNPRTGREALILFAVIIGTYLTRRGIDKLHEVTNFRPLGLLAALIEGFFMTLLIFTGANLVRRGTEFLQTVRLVEWIRIGIAGLRRSLGEVSHYLPTFLDTAVGFVTGTVWPLFIGALAEPVVWLAVAALVYGTHVLSFAEMWRKGEPLSMHLDNDRVVRTRRAAARAVQAGHKGRAVLIEVQEALFGDLNDKYLPTLQSLRLVLRVGLVYLAAYILVYAVIADLGALLWTLVTAVVPLREQAFWAGWRNVVNVVVIPPTETLRLALLATAFARTLQLFQVTADPSALDQGVEVVEGFDFPTISVDEPQQSPFWSPEDQPEVTTVRARR